MIIIFLINLAHNNIIFNLTKIFKKYPLVKCSSIIAPRKGTHYNFSFFFSPQTSLLPLFYMIKGFPAIQHKIWPSNFDAQLVRFIVCFVIYSMHVVCWFIVTLRVCLNLEKLEGKKKNLESSFLSIVWF